MFHSIDITNFRSCQHVRLETEGRVLALVGRNGAGKTNLLSAFRWLAETATSPTAVRGGASVTSDATAPTVITAEIHLGEDRFQYALSIGKVAAKTKAKRPKFRDQLEERLVDLRNDVRLLDRVGEDVRLHQRKEPIRIAGATPALAAIPSLLPDDDSLLLHLRKLLSFFSNVHYYEVESRSGFSDYLPQDEYDEWRKQYEMNRKSTPSVMMRLVYMWQYDRDSFQEVKAILKDMNLIDDVRVHEMQLGRKSAASSKWYLITFEPSQSLAGFGKAFNFTDLSEGTRRIIQLIIALVFDRRAVMLVEQPEDMIHRGILRKLVDVLRTYTAETQLIFATHSSVVLDMLNPSEVRIISAARGATHARKMTQREMSRASSFLNDSGNLSDFLSMIEGDE